MQEAPITNDALEAGESGLRQTNDPIDPRVRIGHVHLKVAAFLSAGGYHHHIALNTWESQDGAPPPAGSTGLFHLALLYPDRRALAETLRDIQKAGIPLDGASDHGVSEALYLRDPDENGLELYHDRPRHLWPRNEEGELAMHTRPLDIEDLLQNAT